MHYSNRINRALIVSATAHAKQTRKATNIPYIIHPVAVALIASQYTDDEDVLIAALFHDILEDVSPTVYSEQQMRDDFGKRVVDIVKSVSEKKNVDLPEDPWDTRKAAYIENLKKSSDVGSYIVAAADKVHNLSSILEDFEDVGEAVWSRFGSSKQKQAWYYRTVSEIIVQKLEAGSYVDNLLDLTNRLEKLVDS